MANQYMVWRYIKNTFATVSTWQLSSIKLNLNLRRVRRKISVACTLKNCLNLSY